MAEGIDYGEKLKERGDKPEDASQIVKKMRAKQAEIGPYVPPTNEELARIKEEQKRLSLESINKLWPPTSPRDTLQQISVGEFDAGKVLAELHDTYGNIHRTDKPFGNPKRDKGIMHERARNQKQYARKPTKGKLWEKINRNK